MITTWLMVGGGAVVAISAIVYAEVVLNRLDTLQHDTNAILNALRELNSDGGLPVRTGRIVPTSAEIAAARNRMDIHGTAHPGAPG